MNDNIDIYIDQKVEKFTKWEKIFFRFELFLIFGGFTSFMILNIYIDKLAGLAEEWISMLIYGLIAIIINMFISLLRILKYVFSISRKEGKKTIWRSVLTLFLSPPSIVFYYILIFVSTIAGCSEL